MKRILIAALIAMGCMDAFGQKIIIDKPNQDGSRQIWTDTEYIRAGFTDEAPIGYGLYVINRDNATSYYIEIEFTSTVNFQIPDNALLLIKTTDGRVIESKNVMPDYKTDDPVGTYDKLTKDIYHRIQARYEVSYADIKHIAENGIAKIRVEKKHELVDAEYDIKRIEKSRILFYSRLKLIAEALAVKKDIRSGF